MADWWESFMCEDQVWYRWTCAGEPEAGPAILVRREGSRWIAGCRPGRWEACIPGFAGPETAEDPSGISAALAACGPAEAYFVRLRPCFPEMPFLVTFSQELQLPPGREISLNLELPPLLSLEVSPGAASLSTERLFTFTPYLLSQAWYGDDTMNGIVCLSLKSAGGTVFAPCVGCTPVLRNRSKTALELDRFVLYTDALSIFASAGQLVCDTPEIEAWGGGDFRMTVTPCGEKGRRLVRAGARTGVGEILVNRGVKIIRNITGL